MSGFEQISLEKTEMFGFPGGLGCSSIGDLEKEVSGRNSDRLKAATGISVFYILQMLWAMGLN